MSLILAIVLSLVGVCLESARRAGMDFRLRLAADASLESVFAEYDDALWGTYHLLFRSAGDRSGTRLGDRMKSYAECSLGGGAYFFGQYSDWFSMEPVDAEISDIVFATDQNGAVFEQAVLDYMKSGVVTILLDEIVKGLGIFGNGQAQQQLEQSSGKGDFSFNSIYGEYKELKEEAEKAEEEEEADEGEEEEDEEPETEKPGLTLDDVLETIKNLMTHGFMGVVVDNPNGISKKNLIGSDFPSKLPPSQKSRKADLSPVSADGSSSSLTTRLMVGEYLLRYLDCYTSGDDPDMELDNVTPEYQVEYVIAGEKSDYDNLKAVVNRLLWLREGLNMIYLISDSGKREETLLLATAMIAPTGQMYLIEPASALLMAAWAFAESLRDVKALMAGGRIPLVKDAMSWKTSLEGLLQDVASAADEADPLTDPGLSYVDYLRIFLAFTNPESRNYRGMDMIQASMRRTKSDFNMTHCVYACSATLNVESPYRFLMMPQFLSSGKEGGYELACTTWFGYKKRQSL